MADLFDLQCDIASFVQGSAPTSQLCEDIIPNGLLPSARLAVHRNNHRLSLTSVLAGMFPVTMALVGDAFFNAIAHQFITAHLPKSPALIDYGHNFPDFLASHDGLKDMAWIADIAQIEAARSAVYHAADDVPLDPAHLQSLAPEQIANLRLTPIAAARLIESHWPVHQVWDAHQNEATISLDQIDLDSGPASLLVHRFDFEIIHTALAQPAAALFPLSANGMALGAAVEAAHDDGTGLGQLLSLGVLKMET